MTKPLDPSMIYRNQTAMLQWLLGLGHKVIFGPALGESDGRFLPETPMQRYHAKPCPYCLEPMMLGTQHRPTREHIVPRTRGGQLTDSNRLIVCNRCNFDKGELSLEEFARWLDRKGDQRAAVVWFLLDRFRPRDSR